jgi:hypothetical protein
MPDEYPTEPEPEPEPEPSTGGGEPGGQVITTRTKDYLARALQTIGTNARDSLGRQTKAGDLDFVGRPLVA